MLEVSYGYWIVLTENILKVQAIITALRIADEPEARFWMMSRWQRFQCPALKRCSASRCWSPSLRARVALASWIHCMGMSSLSVRKRSFSADSSVSSRALCWFRISRTARSRSLHIYKTQQIMLSKHTHTHTVTTNSFFDCTVKLLGFLIEALLYIPSPSGWLLHNRNVLKLKPAYSQ